MEIHFYHPALGLLYTEDNIEVACGILLSGEKRKFISNDMRNVSCQNAERLS